MAAVLVFNGMNLDGNNIGSAPIQNPVFPTTNDAVTINFSVANIGDADAADVQVTVGVSDSNGNSIDTKTVSLGAIPRNTASPVVATEAFGPLAAGSYYADCAILNGGNGTAEFDVSAAAAPSPGPTPGPQPGPEPGPTPGPAPGEPQE